MHFIPQPLRRYDKLFFSQTIISLVQAGYITIIALFLFNKGFSPTNIGYITALMSLATLLVLVLAPKILRQHYTIKTLVHFVFFWAITFILLLLPAPLWFIVLLAFTLSLCASITSTLTQTILYELTQKNFSQKEHTTHLLVDAAWIMSPYLAGIIAYVYNIPSLFIVFSILLFITTTILFDKTLIGLTKKHLRKLERLSFQQQKKFFSQQKHARAYLLSLTPSMWFALIYTFIPIYMYLYGYNYAHIGLFVALSSITALIGAQKAFVLTKIFGTYRLVTYAHATIFTALLLASIANNPQVQLVILLFVTTTAGILEATHQTLKKEQTREEAYVMSSKHPLGAGLTQIIIASSLLLLPIHTIFLTTALLVAPLFWLSIKA